MPSAPASVALALVVHGCGIAITLAVGSHRPSMAALASGRCASRWLHPSGSPVPPTGYGGIELVVSLLADGLVDAGHDVTLFASRRLADQGRARVADADPPDPRELGNPWYDAYHALASYLAGERLRRRATTTPASSARSAARCCAATRPWCTRCTDRGPSRTGRSTRSLAEHVHLVAISDAQRADEPRRSVRGHRAQRHRPRRPTRSAPRRNDVLVYIGRANPDKGPKEAITIARRAGLPLHMMVKHGEPLEREYFDREIAPLLGVRRRAVRERHARREDRAARPGVRDGVPDPVARAVRAGDGRGDGVRHAGGHHQLGRRARAGRGRRHRLPPRRRRRPRRDDRPRRHPRPGRLPAPGSRSASRARPWSRATRRCSSRCSAGCDRRPGFPLRP